MNLQKSKSIQKFHRRRKLLRRKLLPVHDRYFKKWLPATDVYPMTPGQTDTVNSRHLWDVDMLAQSPTARNFEYSDSSSKSGPNFRKLSSRFLCSYIFFLLRRRIVSEKNGSEINRGATLDVAKRVSLFTFFISVTASQAAAVRGINFPHPGIRWSKYEAATTYTVSELWPTDY